MSRILLVSDIHANLAALEAVLRDVDRKTSVDAVWSMGDTVGYGPLPSECLLRLRDLNAVAITGNHDLAATGRLRLSDFNPYARMAAEWTAGVLTDEAKTYAESLPLTSVQGNFTLVHGSPRDPVWEYIVDESVARQSLPELGTVNCVFGHTHRPVALCVGSDDAHMPQALGGVTRIDPEKGRWFINPGSVGQPRDGDPRASYAILDTERLLVSFFRVEYPVSDTQALMQSAGLPRLLYERLAVGY